MAHPLIPTQDLTPFLAERYEIVKSRFPGEGRRKWRLRVAEEFWKLSADDKAAYATRSVNLNQSESAPYNVDEDPLDFIAGEDAPGLGIVVRADFSNEDAWQTFLTKLQEAEAEFVSEVAIHPEGTEEGDDHGEGDEDQQMNEDEPQASSSSVVNADEEMDEDEDGPSESSPIFAIFNPTPNSPLRGLLSSVHSPLASQAHPTNLNILRLLTDVDIRRVPTPPQGTKRIKPPNRLVDYDQWQEVYKGKGIWVYDERSNVDQCVRVVSLEGSACYGTATADSWRARVSHICELQVNLSSGAMTIDFGGLDRYDYGERVKNMEEAERGIV
ncbi:unnamed protein product [Somion occarium]|uniref:Uncharacterized protein n=1 Tax=Somion occarium TaxID=3059160 RepID=A0ABP1DHK3_9APHY